MKAESVRCDVKCARCGRCCLDTRMELSEDDVDRLERLGYPREEFSAQDEDSVLRLRNTGGHCYFLIKAEARCRIYPHRPKGCAIYPVNITEDGEIILDEDCRAASTVTKAEVDRKGVELKALISKIDSEASVRRSR
ncbi:MAG: YkgJ family cysteine cluster protein [Methanomassiliicoccales archaeon]|nr:YkgJ family cysteine cluster protein [Methanomassiliicoccales archaeon]